MRALRLRDCSGGRHAFSLDSGRSWSYSAFDAYNGTVEWLSSRNNSSAVPSSGGEAAVEVEELYLRARPHLLLDDRGRITHLSTGARPTKQSDYVYTLVVPVLP